MLLYQQNGYRIYRTDTVRCGCYIFSYGDCYVLVDTSMGFERTRIERSISKTGIQKLDAIFLTHSHVDHAGNAQYFSDKFRCPVFVSEKGLKNVRNGISAVPAGTMIYGKIVSYLGRKLPARMLRAFDQCPDAKPLTPGIVDMYLGSHARLMDTPGHSDDSVSIILDNTVALIGDSAVNMFGGKFPPFADDTGLLKKTWAALLQTEAKLFCPAHGRPFTRNDFLRAYERMKVDV